MFDLIQLSIDAGLLVLIWMVQLVIYPSFLCFERVNLVRWHRRYTSNISYVVIPLMVGQLILALLHLTQDIAVARLLYTVLVGCSWGVTLVIFVPLHSKISSNSHDIKVLQKLVRYNWVRVVIWTLIMVLSLSKSSIVS